MPTDQIRLELADVDRVDEVRELWLELHRHHRAMVGTSSPRISANPTLLPVMTMTGSPCC